SPHESRPLPSANPAVHTLIVPIPPTHIEATKRRKCDLSRHCDALQPHYRPAMSFSPRSTGLTLKSHSNSLARLGHASRQETSDSTALGPGGIPNYEGVWLRCPTP